MDAAGSPPRAGAMQAGFAVVIVAAALSAGAAAVAAEPQAGEREAAELRLQGHPRLVATKEMLPALRQRAQTPRGRALLEAIAGRIGKDHKHTTDDDAVAHGFLYRMTDEKAHLAAARQAIEQWIEQPGSGATTADRAAVALLAYDLIHDGCDADFRKRMHQAIEATCVRIRDITDCRALSVRGPRRGRQ